MISGIISDLISAKIPELLVHRAVHGRGRCWYCFGDRLSLMGLL